MDQRPTRQLRTNGKKKERQLRLLTLFYVLTVKHAMCVIHIVLLGVYLGECSEPLPSHPNVNFVCMYVVFVSWTGTILASKKDAL